MLADAVITPPHTFSPPRAPAAERSLSLSAPWHRRAVRTKTENRQLRFPAFMKINNINSSQTYTNTHTAMYMVIKLLISLCIKRFYISVPG